MARFPACASKGCGSETTPRIVARLQSAWQEAVLIIGVFMRLFILLALASALCFADAGAQTPATPLDTQQAARQQISGLPPLELMMQQTAARLSAANASSELRGSGPYPAMMEGDLALPSATLYRPADLSRLGSRKLGVLIWGNGGCSNDGASARAHLAEIASHGYLVVAPGKALTGPTPMAAPAPEFMAVTISDMRAALDWALAENHRRGSPYYQRIDERAVAVSGHSCGAMLAILLAEDARVHAVIIHNSGVNPVIPDRAPLMMDMERLRGLHTPVLFVMGGRTDVLWQIGQNSYAAVTHVPAMLVSLDVGHGGTFDQPHGGEAARVAVEWLEWQLRGDRSAAHTFVGADCRLCTDSRWTVQRRGIQ